jgi:hypothetical protein
METRIKLFLSLPLASIDTMRLQERMDAIIRHVFAPLLPTDQLDSYIAGLILLAGAPC